MSTFICGRGITRRIMHGNCKYSIIRSLNMKKMAVMLSALLIFPAMAEVLLNRSFTGEETLNLSGSKPGFVRSAMLDDGMRALEIEVPERSEKMSNCVQIAVPGEKIRGRTVVLTAEIRTALGDPVRSGAVRNSCFMANRKRGNDGSGSMYMSAAGNAAGKRTDLKRRSRRGLYADMSGSESSTRAERSGSAM